MAEPQRLVLRGELRELDLRNDPDEHLSRSPASFMPHLPPRLREKAAPGEVGLLEEVEELAFVASFVANRRIERLIAAREKSSAGDIEQARAVFENTWLALAAGSFDDPAVQELYDRQQALHILTQALRRAEGYPEDGEWLGRFTRVRQTDGADESAWLPNDVAADALHHAFRAVRAAARSAEWEVLTTWLSPPVSVFFVASAQEIDYADHAPEPPPCLVRQENPHPQEESSLCALAWSEQIEVSAEARKTLARLPWRGRVLPSGDIAFGERDHFVLAPLCGEGQQPCCPKATRPTDQQLENQPPCKARRWQQWGLRRLYLLRR